MNECILVVDDDPEIVRAIAILLEKEGYQVLKAYNGMEALEQAVNPALRLIIIDVMMPRLDGLSAVMKIREKRNLPIIVLSAKSEDSDKVLGLSMGADDYVTKPFSVSELMARVDAIYRRVSLQNSRPQEELEVGPFTLNLKSRMLFKSGQPVELTQVEYQIMELFLKNPDTVLGRMEILQKIWGDNYYGDDKIIDVNIRRLRMKIEDEPSHPTHIMTVWGYGYRWEE